MPGSLENVSQVENRHVLVMNRAEEPNQVTVLNRKHWKTTEVGVGYVKRGKKRAGSRMFI